MPYKFSNKKHFSTRPLSRTFILVGNDELKAFKSVRVADVQSCGCQNSLHRASHSFGEARFLGIERDERIKAQVAQLDRALAYEARGWGFKSFPVRQNMEAGIVQW